MSSPHTIKIRLRAYNGPEIAIGPGKADLMEAIKRTGSISAAGRDLGLSYRRAWLLVDVMNRTWTEPLVSTAKGGTQGGGAHLTPLGHEVLALYRNMERATQRVIRSKAGTELLSRLARDVRPEQ